MRLATFNMESFGADRHDPDALTPRLDALRPKILELEADILCLQEVNAQKRKGVSARQFQALELLLEGTPYEKFHLATSERPSGKGPGDRHNLVVLSRFPITRCLSLYQAHAHPPHWQPKTAVPAYHSPQTILFDRPVLQVEIDIGTGRPLHVFCVHLRAPIAAMIRGGKAEDGEGGRQAGKGHGRAPGARCLFVAAPDAEGGSRFRGMARCAFHSLCRPERACGYDQLLRKKCGLAPNLRLNWREKCVAELKPEASAISVTDMPVSFISA